ncbi:MAG: hypothetical protein A2V85_16825 [Chloroflexi bacterium RBG_16_72_14]|nr:MAG: hypothetical protein A2V85_16825 [Chloroflexi bacterium RBG_16_72_14]
MARIDGDTGPDRALAALAAIAAHGPLRAWDEGTTDLPWADPAFSERMLREHLDQRHDLASRRGATIERQVDRLVAWLGLRPGMSLLDLTCGPGLVARAFAERGIVVTGVDVAPAAIRYARELNTGLACTFVQADVRTVQLPAYAFDAAVYLYGQCAVLRPPDLRQTLARVRAALRPGAVLALEAREAARVDRGAGTSWWSGADDLWGVGRHLVLAEHGWDEDAGATVERYHVVTEATGELSVHGVTERALEPETLRAVLAEAGFPAVDLHPAWDGLTFDDAADWVVAVCR